MLRSKAGIAVSRLRSSHQCGSTTYTSVLPGSMNATPIRLIDLFRYYQKLNHQNAAIEELEQEIRKAAPSLLRKDQDWYNTWKAAVPAKSENTWEGIKAMAKTAGAKFPEVVAAQWALESGWGKHTSGKNNFFGLKGPGTSTSTSEFINGEWVTITDEFINFSSPVACIDYLVQRWYRDYKNYKDVNHATSRDDCARALVREGYATDPGYAEKLIRLMNENEPAQQSSSKIRLSIPYEYQLDNTSGTGYRECFSSSCAMLARYYGKVGSDDEYNRIRSHYGDTTSTTAQVNTLRSLGLDARFISNGTPVMLENELKNSRPVAVGWLHHGPVQAPQGGGHWTCLVGLTPNTFIFHDPNGEADMINGGYVNNTSNAGEYVEYSRKNWLRRWEIDGPGTGWAIIATAV